MHVVSELSCTNALFCSYHRWLHSSSWISEKGWVTSAADQPVHMFLFQTNASLVLFLVFPHPISEPQFTTPAWAQENDVLFINFDAFKSRQRSRRRGCESRRLFCFAASLLKVACSHHVSTAVFPYNVTVSRERQWFTVAPFYFLEASPV